MPPTPLRLAVPLALFAALAASPALAQGLGLDVSVGGVSIKVGVGGNSGPLEVGVNAGGGDLSVSLGGGGTQGASGGPGNPDAQPQKISPQGVLEAVRTHRVLPLEDILVRAQMLNDDQIIDAQLIAVRGILLYQIKVLGEAGDVSQYYFYARSGLPVQVH